MLQLTSALATEMRPAYGRDREPVCRCSLGECRTELLPLLSEVSKAVSRGSPSTLNLVLRLMQKHMQVLRGMVSLYDPGTGHIFIHEGLGLSEEEIARGIYQPGKDRGTGGRER